MSHSALLVQEVKVKRKKSDTTHNADGTYTLKMTDGVRTESITRKYISDAECQHKNDLFRYFGIDSVIAGKPVQSDIDFVAAKAVR
jgi:hypothetical protein